jgi:triphosphatase
MGLDAAPVFPHYPDLMADRADAGAGGDPVEIEWQFDALDLRPVERWLSALPVHTVQALEGGTVTALAMPTRRLVDTYLDTDDWRLAGAGFVLRTRRRGRHEEATLKDTRPAEESGLRTRLEVTELLPPGGVDALGPDGVVGRRIRAVAGTRQLLEVLQVRTRRRPFTLRVGGVDAAEVALDDTSIVVGSGQRPMTLRRVEVEVRSEWLEALEPLVSELRESCGLRPASLSKFEAGLLAVGRAVPAPPDLGPTEIGPAATMGELAFAVIRRQLRVLREKEPGTRLGEDPEELHDMRVATRRLRAALDAFMHVLPARARTYRAELSWLGGVLGEVRDLDVQLEGLRADAGSSATWDEVLGRAGHTPLEDLIALLERDRDAARADLLRALDSVRWERLARGLATMVRQGPLRRSAAGNAAAVIGVPELVVQRHDAVRKAAKRAHKSGRVTDFHRLRIRCKRLRYSLEFGAELYEGASARYVRQLAGLQDQLGRMQDDEVAATRLAELAAGDAPLPAATVFVMGALAERHHRGVERQLRRLPKEVAKVGGREWQDLLRVIERRRAEAEAAVPPVRRTLRAVPGPPAYESKPQSEPEPEFVPDAPRPLERPVNIAALNHPSSPRGRPTSG